MPELVSLINSAESVSAAVQNGADAVCVRISSGISHGLSAEEFARASEFCRVRGVKIYADLAAFVGDSDLPSVVAAARQAWLNGADAIRVSDIGLILSLRRTLPDAPIHLSPKMNIHSADGVKIAAAMGISRVSVSPELSLEDLRKLLSSSPIEIEVLTHGFLCPAFGGQCVLSPFTDGSTTGRGECSRECLSEYNTGTKNNHPFAMKDVCLSGHIEELYRSRVSAFLLDGTDRRPEYIAVLTAFYSRALKVGKLPSDDELNLLTSLQPTELTDGYITSNKDEMFGAASAPPDESSSFLSAIRRGYLRREFQRVPVTFTGDVSLGGPLRLTVQDDLGNSASGEGGKGELAFHRELTVTALQTELFKTGGTPFYCESVRCRISKGLTVRQQDIADLRDRLLAELMEKRKPLGMRSSGEFSTTPRKENSSELPLLTVSVLRASQLSPRLLELAPPVIYIPIDEVDGNEDKLEPFIKCPGISLCVVLPCTIFDREKPRITELLLRARQIGINEVQIENIGHIIFVRQMGFKVRGGAGLNVLSSGSLLALRAFRLASVTLSPELRREEITQLSKHIPAELTVYGRLPLMVTENCLVKNITGICSCESFSGIADMNGMIMPVVKSHNCRTTVYSARKLYLARSSHEYMNMGLWGVRLSFTTENPRECAAVAERFLGLGTFEPSSYMSGKF